MLFLLFLQLDNYCSSDSIFSMILEKNPNQRGSFTDVYQLLAGGLSFVELPHILVGLQNSIESLHTKCDSLHDFFANPQKAAISGDHYMTPSEARNYLGFSKNTFDKYRYKSKIKISGYQLDGKTWFKKSDLDRFMLTYEAKNLGCA